MALLRAALSVPRVSYATVSGAMRPPPSVKSGRSGGKTTVFGAKPSLQEGRASDNTDKRSS
jgi:hypothetical protein